MLQAHSVTCVADVRTIPRSRHNPQLNVDALPKSLKRASISYIHLVGLGGLRHTSATSPNTGWRTASFRGFADHMQTPEFEHALEELLQLATRERIALMCAEAVPWRCHRSMIAHALVIRRIQTEDIMSINRRQIHLLTPFAKVKGTQITYQPEDSTGSKLSPQRA